VLAFRTPPETTVAFIVVCLDGYPATLSTSYATTPGAIVGKLYGERELLWTLVKRDFIGRYRGSIMGVAWSLLNPLLMLAIYTFVFSVAFRARWGAGEESRVAFALVLFPGMIVHGFFAECLNRAPSLITGHTAYVKKIVFPLELLPWMAMLSASMHFVVSFSVFVLFCAMAGVPVHAGVVLVPVILAPLAMMTIGLSWILASLGVYLRDLSQITGMLTTVVLFLAPVFYPIQNLPDAFRAWIFWNPITLPILQVRDAVLWGTPLAWGPWIISLVIGLAIAWFGFWWFQRSRRGFADVV
jgi:lipopolysaccharide transport system permease protein